MNGILFEPMVAFIGLGAFEIILLLLALLVFAAMVAGAVVLVVWLTSRKKKELTNNPPTPTGTKRFCHQCGKEMSADAPQGLCPTCLMKVAVGTEGGSPDATIEKKPAPPAAEIAKHFPQLEILELLGQGGMGMVYKARQKQLDRTVALKVLPPELCRDPAFVERFTREAKALARLSHPNIVAVYDFGQSDGLCYVIMEYVDGLNLRQMEISRRLAPREALDIVPRICEALQFAHDQGIVHRDIKPENILIDKQGRVKIADFGLAKILGQPTQNFRLTGSAHIMGTPHYMAPEQVERPLEVDHRADIYSLGVVFYEMLTGELPLGRFAAPSQKVQVDVRLDEVVLKTLEKEPQRRYQQASEVKTQVETITSTPGARPAGATAGAANGDKSWKLSFARLQNGKAVILWPVVLATTALILGVIAIAMLFAFIISNRSFQLGPSLLIAAGIALVWMAGTVIANYWMARASLDGKGRRVRILAFILLPFAAVAGIVATVSIAHKYRTREYPSVVWVAEEPAIQVHGLVTDADTGEPISGVRVADIFFERGPERAVRVFWTDSTGRYLFNTWDEGNHVINFSAPNYEAAEITYVPRGPGTVDYPGDFQLHKKGATDVLKPIPPEAAALFDAMKSRMSSFEGRADDPSALSAMQQDLAKTIKEISALLKGTSAESLVNRQNELIRELAAAQKSGDESKKEDLKNQIMTVGKEIEQLIYGSTIVTGSPSVPANGFGPTIEKVITLGETGPSGFAFINFEKGEILPPPYPLQQDSSDQNLFKRSAQIDTWIAASDIDFAVQLRTNNWSFVPLGTRLLFRQGEAGEQTFLAQTTLAAANNTFADPAAQKGFYHSYGGAVSAYPVTASFIFKTRTAHLGLLQVTGFTNEPRGLKLRYKMSLEKPVEELTGVEARLADLLTRYTEQHPLVIQARQELQRAKQSAEIAESQKAVLSAKLREAEEAAAIAAQQFKVGRINSAEYQAAQDEVLIRKAELSGDAVAIERAKLVATQRQVDALKAQVQVGLASAAEQQAAQRKLETQLAELRLAQANQPSAPVYGSIIDVTLTSVADQKPVKGFDLEQNRQIPLPASLEKGSESQFFQWMSEQGVDLMAFGHRKSWDIFSSARLLIVDNSYWDNASERKVRPMLRPDAVTRSLPLNEDRAKSGFKSYRLDINTPLPLTLVFETTSGAYGVLQVTAFPITPAGINFRYKLIGRGDETSNDRPREWPDTATLAEIDTAAKLDFDNSRMQALSAIAARPNLSAAAQVQLVKTALTRLDFENAKLTVLQSLIKNPAFGEAGRQAIMENLDKITFEHNKQTIMNSVNQRLSKNR